MAKKKAAGKKISKTDAIREALKTTKDGSPTLVAKKLNAQGVKVTPQYVSTIKAMDKRRALSGTPPRKPGRPLGSGKNKSIYNGVYADADYGQASELMLRAVDLVLTAGPSEARRLINTAVQMVERIKAKKR